MKTGFAGLLALVVGPSGVGKDTLIDAARLTFAKDPRFVFPRRIVSRPPSAAEGNAHLDAATLGWLAAEDAFALHWEAHGHAYAVPRSIEQSLGAGALVTVNVSRSVVEAARARYPVSVIQVEAPPETLMARLQARGRASDGDIGQRLARAEAVSCKPDIVFRNEGPLAQSCAAFCALLAELAKRANADEVSSPRFGNGHLELSSDGS